MTETYVVLGVAAGVFFLVGAARIFSLRRYESLFDGAAPRESRIGGISGSYSGRGAEIVLVPSDRIMHRPASLQLSLDCAAPFEVNAVRESLATGLRKAVGVQPDRKTGLEDLDRLFAFQFYDRRTMEGCLSRIEVRESFISLAELGAESVRLNDSRLTVDVPMKFIVPLGVERVRRVLAAILTLGSAMESAASAGSSGDAWTSVSSPQTGEFDAEGRARGSRRAATAIAAPVFYAVFFVAMIIAFLIVGPFWDFDGKVPWRVRMDIVSTRLPLVALLSGVSGLLAGLILPRKPILWGLRLAWPLILHAAPVWALFLFLRGTRIPEIGQELVHQSEFVRAVLTAATTAPAVVFGSGVLGALMGKRLSGARSD